MLATCFDVTLQRPQPMRNRHDVRSVTDAVHIHAMNDVKTLVAGATGTLGRLLAREATARGWSVALAGRDPDALRTLALTHGGVPARTFDAYDLDACAALGPWAQDALGGLDAAITTFGTIAFGPDRNVSAEVDEHLITVNTLAPMSVLRGSASLMHHGTIAATTGAVVDLPVAGAAAYTASKAALSAWLTAIRRERRGDGLTVIDARFPHMDTGFAQRAVAGTPPPLPTGADPQAYVTALLDAIGTGARIIRAAPDGRPALER